MDVKQSEAGRRVEAPAEPADFPELHRPEF